MLVHVLGGRVQVLFIRINRRVQTGPVTSDVCETKAAGAGLVEDGQGSGTKAK